MHEGYFSVAGAITNWCCRPHPCMQNSWNPSDGNLPKRGNGPPERFIGRMNSLGRQRTSIWCRHRPQRAAGGPTRSHVLVQVRWGEHSMVEALRALLRAALAEPLNQRFQLLCEHSLPLQSPALVYQQLVGEARSRVDACDHPEWDEHVRPAAFPPALALFVQDLPLRITLAWQTTCMHASSMAPYLFESPPHQQRSMDA